MGIEQETGFSGNHLDAVTQADIDELFDVPTQPDGTEVEGREVNAVGLARPAVTDVVHVERVRREYHNQPHYIKGLVGVTAFRVALG
jgi:hypothetical protein